MIAYWSSFMRKGKPEAPGLPQWTPWPNSPSKKNRLVLDADEQNLQIRMERSFSTVQGLRSLGNLLENMELEHLLDYLQALLGILGIDVSRWL